LLDQRKGKSDDGGDWVRKWFRGLEEILEKA